MAGFAESIKTENGQSGPIIGLSAALGTGRRNNRAPQTQIGLAQHMKPQKAHFDPTPPQQREVRPGPGRSALPHSENAVKKAERRKTRNANREPSGVWPAMSIGRPIVQHDPEWIRFHMDYADSITGTGDVPPITSWFVEYFSGKELHLMLDKRYREIARTKDKSRATQAGNGIRGTIQKFVNKQLLDLTQATLLELGEDRTLRTEGRHAELEAPSVEAFKELDLADTGDIWERGRFEVSHTEGFGSHRIGLMFGREARQTFRKERRALGKFMASGAGLGLDTSRISHDWEPRITILQTFLPVGEISGLHEVAPPLAIELQQPRVCYIDQKMV